MAKVSNAQLQAQVEALMAQNESLVAMVKGMGAQVDAPAKETAKLFEPKQVTAKDTPELHAHLESVYGLTPATVAEKVAQGRAGAMSNIEIRVDEKTGMLWIGHAYTRAFGTSEKGGNPVLYHGGGMRGVQISRKLASGELLEISYGLPAWCVVRKPKAQA